MRNWRLVLITVATMTLAACNLLGPSAEVRYRITVEINTPEGVRSAFGVWAFELMPGTINQSHTSRFRGEAIPVALPDGRTVFALLDLRGINNNPVRGVQGVLPENALARRYYPEARYPAEVGTSRTRQIEYLTKHVRNKVRLDCRPNPFNSECPMLVTFRDPVGLQGAALDLQSVVAIEPDDMAATLGRGYSLAGIYLQITDDAPTRQLSQFEWENVVTNTRWDGPYANRPLPGRLNIFSFKQWDS